MVTIPRDFAGRFTTRRSTYSLDGSSTQILGEEVTRVFAAITPASDTFDEIWISPTQMTASNQGLLMSSNTNQILELRFSDWGAILLDAWYGWGSLALVDIVVQEVLWRYPQ